MKRFLLSLLVMMAMMTTANAASLIDSYQVDPALKLDAENTLLMELKDGVVVIQLYPDMAPHHVARIKELVRQKFYDGIVFHRVIDGFMAQTGDPTGTGRGGSGQNLRAEFSNASFQRGTVGMARAQSPDSGDSQFFICFQPSPFLNGQYTVFGQVVAGMPAVDKIKRGVGGSGMVQAPPDTMVRVVVLADVAK